jgi:hypothetical protein
MILLEIIVSNLLPAVCMQIRDHDLPLIILDFDFHLPVLVELGFNILFSSYLSSHAP